MTDTAFIHLDVHTEYSISDGICCIEPLLEAATANRMPAIAITDRMNLFAVVKFYRAALKAGIKPLIGAEISVIAEEEHATRLLLFCRHAKGYQQLTHVLTEAYRNPSNDLPMVKKEWLTKNTDGLIAVLGRDTDIGQALLAGQKEKAHTCVKTWSDYFPGRFYLSISRIGREQEQDVNQHLIELAQAFVLPLVATNEVRFIDPGDFTAHEARVAIHDGFTLANVDRPKRYTAQQYLRTTAEMQALFSDLPQALQNTIELAKRCNVELSLDVNYLPQFPAPEGESVEHYLLLQAEKGLHLRCRNNVSALYSERLHMELKVINAMGFASYFLIVADFVQWAKDHDIPVGPGRGSGVGSLVAYVLGITDLDPLPYDLLFERFLNPERVSLPDFDIDFCMERRDEVIEYVANRYGRSQVAQIITFGTMAAKAVVRDVGRVLGHPYGFVDKLAKLIPFELGMTLEQALIDAPILRQRYDQEEEVKDLIDLALKLEGITRNAGKHAGGVVIAPAALTDFVALYCESDSDAVVTQLDKDDVESIGLVKFDFLGLRTLTIIHRACDIIRCKEASHFLTIHDILLDDLKTFQLLQRCDTTAIFQLESRGMKDLIKRLKPDCFEDIIALVALFRPGPLQSGMVDDFINRKQGRAAVTYLHPSLEPILRPTYGVILYQEQVMQIAQVLAGYALGSADLLRRAMGKKKPEEMAKQREIFVEGAVSRGVKESLASTIFDLMEKFSGYGFNKSHAAAYALIAYQTAWLKAHYAAEFMAAVLSSDMDNTDKIVTFIEDCRHLGLTVVPPDINRSDYRFTVDDNAIIYGLGAIKGAGFAALDAIVEARKKEGDFKSLFDLCLRVDVRKVNRRVLEALVRAGAMDVWQVDRAVLLASIDVALKLAVQQSHNHAYGQADLFGSCTEDLSCHYVTVPKMLSADRLTGEKMVLGFYCSGHPLDALAQELRQLLPTRIKQLRAEPKRNQWLGGLIVNLRTVKTRHGKLMQIITLDDQSARIDAVLFSQEVELYRDLLIKDTLIFIEGEVLTDDFSGGLRVRTKRLLSLTQARQQCIKMLCIETHTHTMPTDFTQTLAQLLKPHLEGSCPITIHYQNKEAQASLQLGPTWQVQITDELLATLTQTYGPTHIKLNYTPLHT